MSDPTPPSLTVPAASRPGETDEALFAALVKADRSQSLAPLAAGLAKELNESLTKILGEITVARSGGGVEPFARAEQACLAARDIARRLLSLSQGAEAARTAVSARDLLNDAVGMAGAGSSAEITVEASQVTDQVWVDPTQMTQVFRDLVRNAVESMSPPPQKPRVQLRATSTTVAEGQVVGLAPGDYVEFEVRDNGCGISPENLEKIWDPYFTTKKHGSGLGLPAAVTIVRRHGGQIGVDSSVGVGSVFTLYLPIGKVPGSVRTQKAPSARFRTGRILVMDDDPEIRSLIAHILEGLGYKSDLAIHGDEALAAYRRYFDVGRPHDAVLLDLRIIGAMGGEEAFAKLRALDPEVRAVALCPDELDATSRQCLALGFCGVLAKPFTRGELAEALHAILSGGN